jgi:hypothetical protein
VSQLAVPVDAEDLTPDWFTSILQRHAPGIVVTTAEIADAHSGTTGRVKMRLTYAGERGDLPDTLFCKIAPFDNRQRKFLQQTGIGAMEAKFYASLAPDVPVRVPQVWHADTNDDGGFVMVLEDLDASGCVYPRPTDPDVDERAASTVEEFAHLHARHWEDKRFDRELAWVPDRAGFGAGGGKDARAAGAAGQFIRFALEQFADEMPTSFEAVGTLYADRAADVLDLWDAGERTLIHGDPHSANLFTDTGRTGFFDWAMFSHSPGMRDVAYYCCNSIPTDIRREIEGDLLDLYRRTLAGHGIEIDADLIGEQYRLFAVFSWVSAASTAAMGDRWQPARRALAAMERTTNAVEDLDSVGLLEQLLP